MKQKYLITLHQGADIEAFLAEVQHSGCQVPDWNSTIPMKDGELVVILEGTREVGNALKTHPAVRKVSPASDMELY